MPESVYKVIELVGSSEKSWQDAVESIVTKAAESLRDIRIVEVVRLDTKVDEQKVALWRDRVRLSFKYEGK